MPLSVFCSYSHKDSALRDELEAHLAQLVHDGLILPWTDRCLSAGDEWQVQIDEHVRSAGIILMLVSADFLASPYCYGVEMAVALERHAKEHAVLIPVILRPVDWRSCPLAKFQALPRDAKAVTLWANRDEAFAQIAEGVRQVAVRFQAPPPVPPRFPLQDRQQAQARMLDAAMPGHIVKDRATELLVLIRRPESEGLRGVLQQDEEAEARPEDVRSKGFEVVFPFGPTGEPGPLKVAVQLTSPDFSPGSQTKNIFIPFAGDSLVCPFLLTPIRVGSLLVVIELMWEDAERGYRRLKTNCVAEAEQAAVFSPVMNVVRMEVGTGERESAPVMAARAPVMPAPVMAAPAVVMAPPGPAAAFQAEPSKKTASVLASPMLKAGVAVLVVAIGTSLFLMQNGSKSTSMSSQSPITPAAPPFAVTGPVLEDKVTAASVAFDRINRQGKSLDAVTAAAIQEGRQDLAAARIALTRGDRAEAKKRLAAANVRLLQIKRVADGKK